MDLTHVALAGVTVVVAAIIGFGFSFAMRFSGPKKYAEWLAKALDSAGIVAVAAHIAAMNAVLAVLLWMGLPWWQTEVGIAARLALPSLVFCWKLPPPTMPVAARLAAKRAAA